MQTAQKTGESNQVTLFSEFRLSLLDGSHHHVSNCSSWHSVQATLDALHRDDVQVLCACVVSAVHDGTHGQTEGHAELGSSKTSPTCNSDQLEPKRWVFLALVSMIELIPMEEDPTSLRHLAGFLTKRKRQSKPVGQEDGVSISQALVPLSFHGNESTRAHAVLILAPAGAGRQRELQCKGPRRRVQVRSVLHLSSAKRQPSFWSCAKTNNLDSSPELGFYITFRFNTETQGLSLWILFVFLVKRRWQVESLRVRQGSKKYEEKTDHFAIILNMFASAAVTVVFLGR